MAQTLSRREFLSRAAAGIGAAALGAKAFTAQGGGAAGPNIVYLFADQMRFCAMGCAGDAMVKTPNLDRMAEQGMMLTNAISCTPLCTPYRAQILTGRWGHTTGMITNDIRLPPAEVTIAEALKARGYATGYIGKWHLNGARRAPVGDIRHNGFIPPDERQGFDTWAALECSHQYYNTWYFRDTPEPIKITTYEPDVQTDLAIEFLKQNKARPFLLMLSYGPPHNPYKPPEKYDIYDPAKVPLRPNVPKDREDAARQQIAQYYGLITSLDACVGRIMAAMEELGIAGNTILCFTSDHGDMLHSQGQQLKQRPWEESCHVPFLMRWPEKIKAGQKKDVLFSSVDVMPTLLGLAGAPVPENVQGLNLAPVLLGEGGAEPEAVYMEINSTGGGGGYIGPWRGVRTKEWLYAWSPAQSPGSGDWLLYNIKDDPYEMKNLIADPEARPVREKLRGLMEQWRKATGDTIDLAEIDAKAERKAGAGKGAKARDAAGAKKRDRARAGVGREKRKKAK